MCDPCPAAEGVMTPRKVFCVHLGLALPDPPSSCRKLNPHGCDKGHDRPRPAYECQTCADYEPQAIDEDDP